MEFMRGFTAARELHARAAEAGCFVESVCLGASLVDAMLRVGLVLQHQLDTRTREVPVELVLQDPGDKAISERQMFKRARDAAVIDSDTFDVLSALYDDRNRVIHRYVISRISTSDVLDIAIRYERAIQGLTARIHDIEAQQVREGVGITVSGPKVAGAEGQAFLDEFSESKHTEALARLIRGS